MFLHSNWQVADLELENLQLKKQVSVGDPKLKWKGLDGSTWNYGRWWCREIVFWIFRVFDIVFRCFQVDFAGRDIWWCLKIFLPRFFFFKSGFGGWVPAEVEHWRGGEKFLSLPCSRENGTKTQVNVNPNLFVKKAANLEAGLLSQLLCWFLSYNL